MSKPAAKSRAPRVQMIKPVMTTMDVRQGKVITGAGWRAGKTTNQRGYTYQWQQARMRFLRAYPLCCYCQRDGRLAIATVVDHIVPHQGDEARFWDESNWQPLCKPCHDGVKAKEERGQR